MMRWIFRLIVMTVAAKLVNRFSDRFPPPPVFIVKNVENQPGKSRSENESENKFRKLRRNSPMFTGVLSTPMPQPISGRFTTPGAST
jgi:hypothetical protein